MEICLASECDLESIASLEKDIFKDFWSFDMIKSQFETPNSVYIIAKNPQLINRKMCIKCSFFKKYPHYTQARRGYAN